MLIYYFSLFVWFPCYFCRITSTYWHVLRKDTKPLSSSLWTKINVPAFVVFFRISISFIRICIILYSVWSIYFSSRFLIQQLTPLQQNQFKTDEKITADNNIGYKDYSEFVRYPQIDAVYTWVNGSDPIWYQEMLQYKKQYNLEHNIEVEEKGDTATSANRFRDNDELK